MNLRSQSLISGSLCDTAEINVTTRLCDLQKYNLSTLLDVLNYRQQHQPKQVGYRFLKDGEHESGCLTYLELAERSDAIASQLRSSCNLGDRVLLLHPPGLEFIASLFGCLKAAMIAVPVAPPKWCEAKLERLRLIKEDSQAKIGLTTASELQKISLHLYRNSQLPDLELVATDEIAKLNNSYETVPEIDASDISFLQYTSDYSNTVKAVIITHKNLLHNLTLIHNYFDITPKDSGVIWLPPYYSMGLIAGILQPLFEGNIMTLMPSQAFLQKPIRWLQAISNYGATISGAPNFAYELTHRQFEPSEVSNLDLSSWEIAFCGVEPIRKRTIENFTETFKPFGFYGNAFHPCYGRAETTLFVSGGCRKDAPVYHSAKQSWVGDEDEPHERNRPSEQHILVSCSRIWPAEDIRIVEPQTLSECSEGEVGEIWIAGDSVALGYWNQPVQTRLTFQAHLAEGEQKPYLRTGDWGFIDDGQLFVMESIKNIISIQNRQYHPRNIEATVEGSHSALGSQKSVALSLRIDQEDRLIILQEIDPENLGNTGSLEIIEKIIQAVADKHGLDVHTIALLKTNSLPRTSEGQIYRRACRAIYLEGKLNLIEDWSISFENKQSFLRLKSDIDRLILKIEEGKYVR